MDRNDEEDPDNLWSEWSLSARRAWIEMERKEREKHGRRSLSARRAWIEIRGTTATSVEMSVALRKESVDRNGVVKGAC